MCDPPIAVPEEAVQQEIGPVHPALGFDWDLAIQCEPPQPQESGRMPSDRQGILGRPDGEPDFQTEFAADSFDSPALGAVGIGDRIRADSRHRGDASWALRICDRISSGG